MVRQPLKYDEEASKAIQDRVIAFTMEEIAANVKDPSRCVSKFGGPKRPQTTQEILDDLKIPYLG